MKFFVRGNFRRWILVLVAHAKRMAEFVENRPLNCILVGRCRPGFLNSSCSP